MLQFAVNIATGARMMFREQWPIDQLRQVDQRCIHGAFDPITMIDLPVYHFRLHRIRGHTISNNAVIGLIQLQIDELHT